MRKKDVCEIRVKYVETMRVKIRFWRMCLCSNSPIWYDLLTGAIFYTSITFSVDIDTWGRLYQRRLSR